VDGTGLQEIEDESVAKAILEKVNKLNGRVFVIGIAITAVFCAIPVR